MGQNNFVLMGVLEINSEKTKKLGEFDDLSYLHAFIHSGRREDGEIHPVLITGDAAKIAYAAFEKRPKGAIGVGRWAWQFQIFRYIHPSCYPFSGSASTQQLDVEAGRMD